MRKNFPKVSGFTLIELLVVLGITAILVGLGLTAGIDFYRRYSLDSERDILVGVLRKARNMSVNNLDELPHGLFFEANRYTAFEGASYASRNPASDQLFIVSPTISISGPGEIIFRQLDGNANTSGTIILSDGLKTNPIEVNYEGRIN